MTKKSNDIIDFNVKIFNKEIEQEGNLIKVASLGTGFLKLSKSAILKIWNYSPEYSEQHKTCRMVFAPDIIDGQLYSEDVVFCQKWIENGGEIWVHPSIVIEHVGTKVYRNNLMELLLAHADFAGGVIVE